MELITPMEQEEFCLALDDGLTEAQLRELLFCSLETMANMRRAFVVENNKY